MRATETKFPGFLKSPRQFIIPIYPSIWLHVYAVADTSTITFINTMTRCSA